MVNREQKQEVLRAAREPFSQFLRELASQGVIKEIPEPGSYSWGKMLLTHLASHESGMALAGQVADGVLVQLIARLKRAQALSPETRQNLTASAAAGRFRDNEIYEWHGAVLQLTKHLYMGGVQLGEFDLLIVPPDLVDRAEEGSSLFPGPPQFPLPRSERDRAHRHTSFA